MATQLWELQKRYRGSLIALRSCARWLLVGRYEKQNDAYRAMAAHRKHEAGIANNPHPNEFRIVKKTYPV